MRDFPCASMYSAPIPDHHESLLEASQYIETIERLQGLKIACPEEIPYRQGWVTADKIKELAQPMAKNGYGQYLLKMLTEKVY